jgi:hypothetical protein
MTHLTFGTSKEFSEDDAPDWLKYGGIKGSTMDARWFWNDHVMKLEVGETIDTDFQRIERLEDCDHEWEATYSEAWCKKCDKIERY